MKLILSSISGFKKLWGGQNWMLGWQSRARADEQRMYFGEQKTTLWHNWTELLERKYKNKIIICDPLTYNEVWFLSYRQISSCMPTLLFSVGPGLSLYPSFTTFFVSKSALVLYKTKIMQMSSNDHFVSLFSVDFLPPLSRSECNNVLLLCPDIIITSLLTYLLQFCLLGHTRQM